MKRTFTRMLLVLILFAVSVRVPAGQAAVFMDTLNFDDAVHPLGYPYKDIADSSGFFWIHNIQDNLGGSLLSQTVLLNASLSLTYAKTEGNELWSLPGLGSLGVTVDTPLTGIFNLDATSLFALQSNGMYTVKPAESTSGRDTLRLIRSTLSGNYEMIQEPNRPLPASSTPEPLTGVLLLSGLGTAWLGRRFRK